MKNILIVDDEFGLAEALQALLTDEGYCVTTAVNGRQGLEKIVQSSPDLIIVDYMMPVMNGIAMLTAVNERDGLNDTPSILMSGVAEPSIPRDNARYSAYLRKPFELRELLALVKKLIG